MLKSIILLGKMMNLSWAKIAVILLVIVVMYNAMNFKQGKENQEALQSEIQQLKQQALEQQQQMEKMSSKHLKELNAQSQEVKQQSQKIQQQIHKLDKVTNNLAKKQQLDDKIFKENQKRSEDTLKATYLAQGFQTMSMLKVAIAEYYANNGRYPKNNRQAGVANPNSFTTDIIQSVWITGRGKISIIYTKKTGVDKGTLNFTPKYKNGQINWKCTTKDYQSISNYFPQCQYL